jgi:hypothetical protein
MDPAIADRVLAFYRAMVSLRCTCSPRDEHGFQRQCASCKTWYNLHSDLHHVLGALARLSPKQKRAAVTRRADWSVLS